MIDFKSLARQDIFCTTAVNLTALLSLPEKVCLTTLAFAAFSMLNSEILRSASYYCDSGCVFYYSREGGREGHFK